MYLFKTELKKSYLAGRTITFLAKEIGVSLVHLTDVLNRKRRCSKNLALKITDKSVEKVDIDYFFDKQ